MTKFVVVRELDKFTQNHPQNIQNDVTVECGVTFVSAALTSKIS